MRVVQFPSRTLVKWGLITYLRTRRAFVFLAISVAIAILGTAMFWPTGQFQQMASTSRHMLMFISMLFMGEALLFIPGMAAVSVTIEKEQDTFDQLWLTLIRPGGVIAAKLVNVLGVFYLFLIGIMPILGSIFFLIGVDWVQIATVFSLVTATAFSCATAGILCSAFFRKSFVSTMVSYVAMLFLSGIPQLYIMAILGEHLGLGQNSAIGGQVMWVAQVCSPVLSLAVVIEPSAGTGGIVNPWWPILYQIFWGLSSFFLARRLLLKPANPPKVELRKPIDDTAVLERRRRQFPFYLIDPLRRKPSIESHRNPMLIRELRWGIPGRAGGLIRVFYGAFIVYMATAIYVLSQMRAAYDGYSIPFVVMQMIVTVLVIPPLLANSMTKEYEMGNMEFLRSTLLTPYEIVLGKVGASVITLGPLLLASACAGVLMAGCILIEIGPGELIYLFTGYGSLATCVLLSLGIGMFTSVSTRRTATALILSYCLSLILYVGLALAVMSGFMWFRSKWGWTNYDNVAAFFSPIGEYIYGPVQQRGHHIEGGPFNIYWLSNVVLFSGIGLEFLIVTVYRFARSGMKDK